jgi:hypothetical protein
MFNLITRVSAQADTGDQVSASTTVFNPLSNVKNLGQVFAMLINIIIGVGWGLVFIMLAMGFVQYVLSKGEKTAVENAQKWITYSVIGGVGLFFIMVLKTIIPKLFGADDATIPIVTF